MGPELNPAAALTAFLNAESPLALASDDVTITAKIKADYAMGQRVGLDHTPTIYVVSDTTRGTPFVEVVDRTQLYQLIDKVIKEAGPSPQPQKTASARPAPAKKPAQSP